MRNHRLSVLLLCALLLTPHLILAEANKSTAPGIESEALQEETVRAKMRMVNLLSNIQSRFLATIDRLSQIAERVDSRLEKESSAGIDVSNNRNHLDAALRSLEIAESKARALQGSRIDSLIAGGSPDSEFFALREEVRAVQSAVVIAKEELLTSLSERTNEIATSTASEATSTEQQ